MNIDDQLTLFFDSIRETQLNSKYTPEQALARINRSRKIVAAETKFYSVKDSTADAGVSTVSGGETSFTLLDTFLGLQDARDVVTRNGKAVTMKGLAEWPTITDNGFPLTTYGNDNTGGIGMLNGNTFYCYPPAVAGDIFVWWGASEPPDLPAITGGDAYLTNSQAQVTVMHAAIGALEDGGEQAGAFMVSEYKRLHKILTRASRPMGPRLESAG